MSHDPQQQSDRDVQQENRDSQSPPEAEQHEATDAAFAAADADMAATKGSEVSEAADSDAADSKTSAQGEVDLQAELAEARGHVLRAQAEFDNFRKRMRREMEEDRRYAGIPLISDILPVLDNFHRAIESAEKGEQSGGLLEGVKMVSRQMTDVLEKHSCHPIAAEGETFDPNVHQAISQQPTDEHPPGTILHVALTGYRLHDRVIRPAQVIVAAAKSSD